MKKEALKEKSDNDIVEMTEDMHMKHYRIMTLNLFNGNLYSFAANHFSRRIGAIDEMIRKYEPDLIGVQELTEPMLKEMNGIFERYGIVGENRHSSFNDEYSAILYQKDRFEVLHHETLWLSETPQRKGSRLLMSQFPRITTFAHFKDREDKTEISFFNTHLDVNFRQVRIRQARILRDLIYDYHRGSCTFVTGDFNDVSDSETLNIICSASLKDLSASLSASTLRGRIGSARFHQKPVDHILVSEDILSEYTAERIDTTFAGHWPSDHYPLIAEVFLKDK